MTWCQNLFCGSNLWFGMTRKVHMQQLLQMALMSVVYYHQFIMDFLPNGIIDGLRILVRKIEFILKNNISKKKDYSSYESIVRSFDRSLNLQQGLRGT